MAPWGAWCDASTPRSDGPDGVSGCIWSYLVISGRWRNDRIHRPIGRESQRIAGNVDDRDFATSVGHYSHHSKTPSCLTPKCSCIEVVELTVAYHCLIYSYLLRFLWIQSVWGASLQWKAVVNPQLETLSLAKEQSEHLPQSTPPASTLGLRLALCAPSRGNNGNNPSKSSNPIFNFQLINFTWSHPVFALISTLAKDPILRTLPSADLFRQLVQAISQRAPQGRLQVSTQNGLQRSTLQQSCVVLPWFTMVYPSRSCSLHVVSTYIMRLWLSALYIVLVSSKDQTCCGFLCLECSQRSGCKGIENRDRFLPGSSPRQDSDKSNFHTNIQQRWVL